MKAGEAGASSLVLAPLTEALHEWATHAAPTWSPERRHALLWRLGWIRCPQPTLEEVGRTQGLTRERIRQLESKLTLRLARTRRPASSAFDQAIAALRDTPEEPTSPPGRVLSARGLTDAPLPDKGVAELFALLGASEVFEDYQRRLEATVPRRLEAVHLAKALTRSVGVVSVEWVVADSDDVEADAARAALQSEGWCRFLDNDWFWDPATPPGRNRLVNVTIKMLAACGPLTVSEIRGGLDRSYRFGRLPHVPSPNALRLFYAASPRFSLDARDVVHADRVLDPMVELDDTERTLYLILKASPRGVLDRAQFMRRGIAAGLNQNSLGVYSSYSPILDNPVQDCWVLRGSDVSPAVIEASRQPRRVRFHDELWLELGAAGGQGTRPRLGHRRVAPASLCAALRRSVIRRYDSGRREHRPDPFQRPLQLVGLRALPPGPQRNGGRHADRGFRSGLGYVRAFVASPRLRPR